MTSFHSVASAPNVRGHELGDALLVLGAEALRGRREPGRRLLEHLPDDEDAPDAVAGLEGGDLLAHERIGACRRARDAMRYRAWLDTSRSMPPRSCSSWRIVCLNALPSTPTRLAPGTRTSVKNTSQKWRFVVMSVIGRTSMPGVVHRHDDLADAGVRRPLASTCGRCSSSSRRRRRSWSRSSGR